MADDTQRPIVIKRIKKSYDDADAAAAYAAERKWQADEIRKIVKNPGRRGPE